MDRYDHELHYYIYLLKNCGNFEECVKNNVEMVSKIPEILEVVSQEISVAEHMLGLYCNKHSTFEIHKNSKYALDYFNYLQENFLYSIYCKKCLDMNISDLKNCYYCELNVEKAPNYRHELFGEYIHNEINVYFEVLNNLKNAVY
ncbi:hypothetical protein [Methanococcus maripaludis]|uniref:Uncharacterized protein n=1 Tax=Methanococcus maripaludis TaxID=39152 RepID=A0A2L1C8Y4_METMI|nr:hypothetical protein [Methanococcus maripaludis]AVB75670.1 hypothetical protein MMJJ_02520 [Methanococcus maripaludis]MBA2864087.1 hypothetical protein [Methanococcus maripaludis]MBB6497012.1 hypothetical protein [Methanococcus maripaludis]